MNTLIIFYSKFGNTQQVAEAIAEVMATAGTVRTISSDQLDTSVLKDVDLVVMGVPTHKMKLPEVVLPVLDVLPKGALRGVPVAAFDTSYKMSAWLARMTAGRKLAKKLLGDICCFWGNVPPTLMCTGTPEQVKDDVKELIDIFGDNGGLVIDSTIGIPDESKPENVQALTDAAHEYGVY